MEIADVGAFSTFRPVNRRILWTGRLKSSSAEPLRALHDPIHFDIGCDSGHSGMCSLSSEVGLDLDIEFVVHANIAKTC